MEATSNRKAEFSKFFDLFERLTNRALRKSCAEEQLTSVAAEANKPFAVPADLALPAIRNLSKIASNNRTCQQRGVHGDGQVNSNPDPVLERSRMMEIKKHETNKFLTGSWYPFSFKMMLHKLYKLEEWVTKVKEILEKSREDYKPLPEVGLKKKRSGGEYQRRQTLSRPKAEILGSDPEAMRTRRYSGLDDVVPGKEFPMPKSPTKDNGKKSRNKHDEKVIKRHYVGRPRIVAAVPGRRLEDPRAHDSAVTLIEVEGVLCQGYPSEGCIAKSGGFISMVDRDNDGNDCRRLGPSASASEPGRDPSCTGVHRKRALSEADNTYLQILPRKRLYLC